MTTELILNPPADPFSFFESWYADAKAFGIHMPEAMCLSTITPEDWPSARFVLLRGHDDHGFKFFTNYESEKAHDLATHPQAALTFHWALQERQVRIQGAIVKTTTAESDAYWQSRPRGHRLGALASQQSQPIADPHILLERERELEKKFPDEDVPRPAHWGGFRVLPLRIEFWQGRKNRLHDRVRYSRQTTDSLAWSRERLQP